MHCPNPECPDLLEYGLQGEYREEIARCPRCGAALVALHPGAPGREPGAPPPGAPPEGPADLATVARFREPHLAHLARGRLEAEGIEGVLADEHMASINWLYSDAIGGVRILVPTGEAERAARILGLHPRMPARGPEAAAVPGEERCPRCGSPSVRPYQWGRIAATILILLGFVGGSMTWMRRRRRCAACGESWFSGR